MLALDLRRDQGFSLVEILVTILIVGIAFTALLGGLMTSIASSAIQREQATADSVARSAAEWVKDPIANRYVPCATSGTYTFSGLPKYGYSVSVSGVKNWDPAPTPIPASFSPQFQTSQAGCTNDHGLQLITVVVSSPDSRVTSTIQVIKRTVTVP